MSLTERFAAALKHFRDIRQLSQDELSLKAGLDRTYVSQLERGLKSPTLTTLQKLAGVLGIEVHALLREPHVGKTPSVPGDYQVTTAKNIVIKRKSDTVQVSVAMLMSAVNVAHQMIDELYSVNLDISAVLGLRNLSAFIGELVAASIIRQSDGVLRTNPHQDGYPDLLLMDRVGKAEWERLAGQSNDKAPFSPFKGGGIEIKATCGSIPTPKAFRAKKADRPGLGNTRIDCMTGYDWKAHHRDTNNLIGVLWDFIDGRPRIAAMFYSNELLIADWGKIVKPRDGGGRTTSVSIMARTGIQKMYKGWICVLSEGGYAEFLNKKNHGTSIPVPTPEKSGPAIA